MSVIMLSRSKPHPFWLFLKIEGWPQLHLLLIVFSPYLPTYCPFSLSFSLYLLCFSFPSFVSLYIKKYSSNVLTVNSHKQKISFLKLLLCWVGVSLSICKSSYNVSNISYLNSLLCYFLSFPLPQFLEQFQ
jgi:hypothetical protein